jgi:hypothetical protein
VPIDSRTVISRCINRALGRFSPIELGVANPLTADGAIG